MKIKEHGKNYGKKNDIQKESFECEACGCKFEAKKDEYYEDLYGAETLSGTSGISCTISSTAKDYLVCSCPECHKIIKKARYRKVFSTYNSGDSWTVLGSTPTPTNGTITANLSTNDNSSVNGDSE